MLGLTISVAAAFSWATLDALRKALAPHLSTVVLTVLVALGPGVLAAILALVRGDGLPGVGYAIPGLLSLVLNTLGNTGFVVAVRTSPLAVTVPMLSLTPAISTLFAALWLGEVPTGRQLLGIGLVVVGALALPWVARRSGSLWQALTSERGVVVMIGVAFAWAGVIVVDKAALDHATVSVHAAVQSFGVAVLLLGWMGARGTLGELRTLGRHPLLVAGVVAASASALLLQLWAVQLVLVGVVDAIKRAVGLVASVVNGRIWFGERITAPQLGCLVAIGAGVGAIVL